MIHSQQNPIHQEASFTRVQTQNPNSLSSLSSPSVHPRRTSEAKRSSMSFCVLCSSATRCPYRPCKVRSSSPSVHPRRTGENPKAPVRKKKKKKNSYKPFRRLHRFLHHCFSSVWHQYEREKDFLANEIDRVCVFLVK